MNLRRTKAIARKETIQILRDPRSLMMGIAIPVMLLLLFGFALTFDVDQVETVVLDRDRTQLSVDFVDRFGSSHYFKIKAHVSSDEALQKMIDAGKAQMGIVIPHDFSKRINEEGVIPVQIILDGYDSNTANIIQGYAAGLVQIFSSFARTSISPVANFGLAVPSGLKITVPSTPTTYSFRRD